MKRSMVLLTLALAPALFANAALRADPCPFAVDLISPRAAYHAASANAELVAPSATATATATVGRRRPGTAPSNPQGSLPRVNFVDTDLFSRMDKDGVKPTALAADAEFLRRVTLDLTGQIPDAATVTAFLSDTAPDKRTKKIDELLASDAFNDRWTMWFGDLVQNVQISSSGREYYIGRNAYYTFIRDSIRTAKPYDQMVRELLAGKGDSFAVGTANYWVRQIQNNGPIQDTYDNLAAHSGEKFLGQPLLCLSCHSGLGHLELVNGYLKSKQRSDFWGMAAFFATTRARPMQADPNTPNIRKFDVQDFPQGSYQLNTDAGNKTPRAPVPGGSSVATAAYMFTGEKPRTGEPLRDAYGRMLTADRQFARNTVNQLWKEMFGVGLVEPLNAFDLSKLDTQPSNPALLEDLTSELIRNGYSLRGILRTMAVSNAYQLSSVYTPGPWNETWTPYFARHYPHRLPAEMLLDAVAKATSVPLTINVQGMGPVTRAMLLPDPLEGGRRSATSLLLDEFGRGDRDDSARTNDTSISQALSLMNNTVVTTRVKRATANSTMSKVLAATTDPGSVADQLYLATLSRKPTADERTQAINYLKGGTLATKAEDLQFVLLNQLEFLFD